MQPYLEFSSNFRFFNTTFWVLEAISGAEETSQLPFSELLLQLGSGGGPLRSKPMKDSK